MISQFSLLNPINLAEKRIKKQKTQKMFSEKKRNKTRLLKKLGEFGCQMPITLNQSAKTKWILLKNRQKRKIRGELIPT